MPRGFPLLLLILPGLLLAGGCADLSSTRGATSYEKTPDFRKLTKEYRGMDLLQQARAQDGITVSVTDPQTGVTLETIMPGTFFDGYGIYATSDPDERIQTYLGVAGTADEDLTLFQQQPNVTSFEVGTIGIWKLVSAFDYKHHRWVVRGTTSDPRAPQIAHHAIECVSDEESTAIFWDGCRTMLEHATIEY